LLIAADGILTAGKEPAVAGQIFRWAPRGQDDAVAGAEVAPASGVQRLMIRGLKFESLVVHVAAQVFGS
jgi:hypothetical protein